jgi:predicted dehydrogenase
MRSLRTAVVGCGISGRQIHQPVVETHPDLELAAVCDTDEERFATVSGPATYTDVETMLDAEDLDSVHVCTPPGTHVPIAESTLSAGVPTLVEKPAALTTDAVERLIELRDENDTVASVIHNKQFAPFVQKAKRGVERGRIGDVVAVTMLFGEPRDLNETERKGWVFDLPGGELGEGIVHQVYLPLAFVSGLGAIESVATQNVGGYEAPIDFDGVNVQARDGTGERLVSITSLTSSASTDQLVVHGTRGRYTIDFLQGGVHRSAIADPDNSVSTGEYLSENLGLAGSLVGNVARKAYAKGRDAYRERRGERTISNRSHYEQIDRHAAAIRSGGEPPVTLEEAHDTVRVLEAIGEG